MSKKIYKYFSSSVISLVFNKEKICSVKCSFPNQYNDPYELFLGVDLEAEPHLLAYYKDVVQDLKQDPTTCFSKSPIVTPMWAHYSNNHNGFVLEFDIDLLEKNFPSINIKDVSYKDEPSDRIYNQLVTAYGTGKPRHAYFLEGVVYFEAYFSKGTDWSYEKECRLADQHGYVNKVGNNMILDIPAECCTRIIAGKNVDDKNRDLIIKASSDYEISFLQSKISKSSSSLFFEDLSKDVFVFINDGIEKAIKTCENCREPIKNTKSLCPWCSITEEDKVNAAMSNPFRILDKYGMLETYYKRIEKINKKER